MTLFLWFYLFFALVAFIATAWRSTGTYPRVVTTSRKEDAWGQMVRLALIAWVCYLLFVEPVRTVSA